MSAAKPALLVIDAQVAIFQECFGSEGVIQRIAALLAAARAAGAPVIFVQHNEPQYPQMSIGADGWAIHPAIAPLQGEPTVDKQASDSFCQTPLGEILQGLGVEEVVICGLQTDFCVDATCRSALSHGYGVTLASDAHTTGDGAISAAKSIAHHNYVLAGLAHPDRKISVIPAAQISF